MRRVVPVVPARPGVDVKSSAWRNNHVAGVTNTVRKHRCTKTGGQSQSAAIVRARWALGFCSGIGWLVSRAQRTHHARCGERDEGKQESFERDGSWHGALLRSRSTVNARTATDVMAFATQAANGRPV